jgi:hypothetical protein
MKIIKKTVNTNLINISLLSLILVIHSISLFTIDIVIKQIRSKRNNLDEKKKKKINIYLWYSLNIAIHFLLQILILINNISKGVFIIFSKNIFVYVFSLGIFSLKYFL